MNVSPSQLSVLVIGLYLAREWTSTNCTNPETARTIIAQINETIFALPAPFKDVDLAEVMYRLDSLVPLELLPEQLAQIKADTKNRSLLKDNSREALLMHSQDEDEPSSSQKAAFLRFLNSSSSR